MIGHCNHIANLCFTIVYLCRVLNIRLVNDKTMIPKNIFWRHFLYESLSSSRIPQLSCNFPPQYSVLQKFLFLFFYLYFYFLVGLDSFILTFLIVVQVFVSICPPPLPPPEPSPPPTLDPTHFGIVHVSFIHVPENPSHFPPIYPFPPPLWLMSGCT